MRKHLMEESFRHHIIGVVLIVFAFLCVSVMNAFAKVALETVPLGMLLFTQNFLALCLAIFFVFRSPKALITHRLKLHIFRAITGLLSLACLFIAIEYISLVNATLLANSAPLFLPFVVWVWFGQKITKTLWLCLIIGFLGVFFIANPTSDLGLLFDSWMVLIALLGSLFSAIALQCVRTLGSTESPLTTVTYYFLIASIATLPFAVLQWQHLSRRDWLMLFEIAVLLALIQYLLFVAYKYASPTFLGPFNYSVVIFSGIIQWIYWKIAPTPIAFLGIFLICLGGMLAILQQKRSQKLR